MKISHRTYHDKALNPLRHQRSGVTDHRDLWEIHYDPYDLSRVWVRNHCKGGWITLFWRHLHRVAAPFGELAWDHTHRALPGATEEEVADAVADLLKRAHQGPSDSEGKASAKLTAGSPRAPRPAHRLPRSHRGPLRGTASTRNRTRSATTRPGAKVIALPIFDPCAEADKRW